MPRSAQFSGQGTFLVSINLADRSVRAISSSRASAGQGPLDDREQPPLVFLPMLKDPRRNRVLFAVSHPVADSGLWEIDTRTDHIRRLQPNSATVRLARGRLYSDLRQWELALVDFQEVLHTNPIGVPRDTAVLRIWLIRCTRGEKVVADKELRDYFHDRKPEPRGQWLACVAAFLNGDQDAATLLRGARNNDKPKRPFRECNAYFFIGCKFLLAGEKPVCAREFPEVRGNPQAS